MTSTWRNDRHRPPSQPSGSGSLSGATVPSRCQAGVSPKRLVPASARLATDVAAARCRAAAQLSLRLSWFLADDEVLAVPADLVVPGLRDPRPLREGTGGTRDAAFLVRRPQRDEAECVHVGGRVHGRGHRLLGDVVGVAELLHDRLEVVHRDPRAEGAALDLVLLELLLTRRRQVGDDLRQDRPSLRGSR